MPTLLLAPLLFTLLVLGHTRSQAQQGGVDLKIDTIVERNQTPANTAGLRDAQSAGLSVEAYGGTSDYFGAFLFLDAHFGGGYQGGFAYRFALLPIGLTVHDSHHVLSLALSGGMQVQGVTEHQAFGVVAPIRAAAIFNLGSHLHLNAWASNDLALSRGRKGGSDSALLGDEMQAGVSLRIGKGGHQSEGQGQVDYGSGYFVSGLFAERLGSRFWGIGIGHGMHMNGKSQR